MGQLEDNSLWYKYKTEIWSQETPETATVHNIMRVLRSIRNSGRLSYVSAPITSGKIYYDLLLKKPEADREETLREAINLNYNAGWAFVEKLRKRKDIPILYPADMTPVRQEWEQSHFQALWLSIIAEKATEQDTVPEWEYSNGSAEELTHTFQLRLGLPKHKDMYFFNTKEDEDRERDRMKHIQPYDSEGKAITIVDAITTIEKSSDWVRGHGFNSRRLENCLDILKQTERMIEQGFYQ